MRRRALPPIIWLLLGSMALCNVAFFWRPDWQPVHQVDTLTHTVYAYRQWQSTGVKLAAGDRFTVRARGEWSYSPIVGLNGPAGGRPAVPGYPLPHVLGGTLIGRVGESGEGFYVGERTTGFAERAGYLLLRINDDLLGDNYGTMTVEIDVQPAPVTPSP
jgi:hypothetical protein